MQDFTKEIGVQVPSKTMCLLNVTNSVLDFSQCSQTMCLEKVEQRPKSKLSSYQTERCKGSTAKRGHMTSWEENSLV